MSKIEEKIREVAGSLLDAVEMSPEDLAEHARVLSKLAKLREGEQHRAHLKNALRKLSTDELSAVENRGFYED